MAKRSLLDSHHELCREWCLEKNGALTPDKVTAGSSKKVWWICKAGTDHQWTASISNRAKGTSCPYCSNRKLSVTNRLDLARPDLAEEWSVKNDTPPSVFTIGTAKKVWWKCPKSDLHVYQMSVSKRASGRNCPFCAGKQICSDNSLAALQPSLAEEWHYKKNINLSPHDVSQKAGIKVWWKCSQDPSHEWEARILHRSNGRGCPFCSNHKLSPKNSLSYKNSQLANEWHPSKNHPLTPNDVSQFSNKIVWWKCNAHKDHEWEGSIAGRDDNKCPFCSNLRLSSSNSLAAVSPRLTSEWHEKLNGSLHPRDVIAGGSKKYWWRCKKTPEHDYYTSISSRLRGSGCPKCTHQTSTQDIRILSELKYIFDDAVSRYKHKGIEIDVYIPSLKIGVEYDGAYYHKDRLTQDTDKGNKLEGLGVSIIRVRDTPLRKISDTDVCTLKQDTLTKADLNNLVISIVRRTNYENVRVSNYLNSENFVNEDVYKTYISYFPSPFPENSLASTHPHLIDQWDFAANYPLEPTNFTRGSHTKIHWKCQADNEHTWQVSILSRTNKGGTGCPYCAGRKVSSSNSLATSHPELAREWHATLNLPLTPDDVSRGSGKWVWWRCLSNREHEWKTKVRARGISGNGCPQCYLDRIKKGADSTP